MYFKEDSEWEGGAVEEEDLFSVKSFYLCLMRFFFSDSMGERGIWTDGP